VKGRNNVLEDIDNQWCYIYISYATLPTSQNGSQAIHESPVKYGSALRIRISRDGLDDDDLIMIALGHLSRETP